MQGVHARAFLEAQVRSNLINLRLAIEVWHQPVLWTLWNFYCSQLSGKAMLRHWDELTMSKDSRNMEETLQSCFLAGFAYPWSYLYLWFTGNHESDYGHWCHPWLWNQFHVSKPLLPVVLYAFDLPLPDGQWKKLGSFARRTAPSDALVVAVGPLAKRQRSQYDQPWHPATPTRPPGDESMAAPVILWPNSGNACGGEISVKWKKICESSIRGW